MHTTLAHVYAMPASEFIGWQAYFDIYPFTQEREDRRFAMLAAAICNISGKSLKHSVSERAFMPEYIAAPAAPVEKSLKQQAAEFRAFAAKLKAATGKQ